MTNIVVTTEVETWQTRPADPNDSWDQGDTDGRVTNVTAWVEEDAKYSYFGDSLSKEFPDDVTVGTTLYAVVADYSSGSTFGRDGGYSKVLDVFTSSEEAEALYQAAMADPADSRWDSKYSFTYNGKNYYRDWVGYFESLNSLDVWQIVVQGRASNYLNPGNVNYKIGR
jgi:hypothetical protein